MKRRDFLRAGTAALGLGALGRQDALAALAARARLVRARPTPTPQQLAWQRMELAIFVHFGVNTFTDREWGDGKEDPRIFAPTRLDARQWARAAKAGGFKMMILTAKHHDGFCLWPSDLTEHSVKSSPWRDGKGDVVREFVDACRAEGLLVGLYLSPWDRHEPTYGDSPRYNDFYVGQLTELLTRYGPVAEMWFDGANGEGPNGKRQEYDWPRFHRTVKSLQPDALIFSDAGPDIRWIGNERGIAGDPNWCTVDPAKVPVPGIAGSPEVVRALQHGDPDGTVWRPGEADVSIRPGWFWHPAQDDRVRTTDNLIDLYFLSVGRNANLLLNVPPTTEGLFHPTDVRRLEEFGERLKELFATDLAAEARASASAADGRARRADRVVDGDPDTFWSPPEGTTTGWLELDLRRPTEFDVVCLQEAIAHGQSIERYRVEGWNGREWTVLSRGTTIGHKKLDRTGPVTASRVRLVIESALDTPRISRIALYRTGLQPLRQRGQQEPA
jgi:alpha-L-fucosidase